MCACLELSKCLLCSALGVLKLSKVINNVTSQKRPDTDENTFSTLLFGFQNFFD